jgi:hypothetical protein
MRKTLIAVIAFWACGGGNTNEPATAPSASVAIATPSASAAPSVAPSASASAIATSSAEPEPDMPMEFITAMTDSTTLMLKGINVMLAGMTGATPCDQAAAELTRLANDPVNRKVEAKLAAEYAKLDPTMQQAMAPQLIAARTKLKTAGTTTPAKTADGGAQTCGTTPKMQTAAESFRMLMSVGLAAAH